MLRWIANQELHTLNLSRSSFKLSMRAHDVKRGRSYARGADTPNSLHVFRENEFKTQTPSLIPKLFDSASGKLPALQKWFDKGGHAVKSSKGASATASLALNHAYLSKFDSTIVPLEMTRLDDPDTDEKTDEFVRLERPLGDFLSFVQLQEHSTESQPKPTTNLYLAQCPISSLPLELQSDLPTPNIVQHAGRGDIYDSSIWIGMAPTNTPLHRDPNPNLFVQLAGRKQIRIFLPDVGGEIFRDVQRQLGRSGSSASIRGAEMMQGTEKAMLDKTVWEMDCSKLGHEEFQVFEVEPGDAVFIPKGFWHSIKGIGTGITASANWWFR